MGSIFVTQQDLTMKRIYGKRIPSSYFIYNLYQMLLMLFILEESSLRYNGDKSINTIIAKPHISDKLYKEENL